MISSNQELQDAIEGIIRAYHSSTESKSFFAESIKDLESLKERLGSNYIRIAIIGITSSGKSTLLNSLLGEKLLPTAVAPSSSKQVVCGYSANKYAKIIFQESSGKKDIIIKDNILDNLSKYGDEKRNPHNREQVEELQVFSPKFRFRKELIFVDTPGLDAYGLTEHEEITMKLVLPSVDMVLFLTNVKCDSDRQNLDFIDRSTTDDKPLVVVQNKIDSIVEKRSKTYGVEKTKDDVKKEHYKRLRMLLDNAKKHSVKTAPIVQVSAKMPWQESNLEELRQVLSMQVEQNLERFRQLHLNQFWIRLKQDYDVLQNLLKDQATLEASLASKRRLYNGYAAHIVASESLVEEINNNLKTKLNSLLDKALQIIGFITSDSFLRTRTLTEKLQAINNTPLSGKTVKQLSENIKQVLDAFKNNLKEITSYFSSSITKVQQSLGVSCKELNLLERQIVHIHPVGALSTTSDNYTETEKYKVTTRVKRQTIGGWIKRGLGVIFGQDDWGYDEIEETKERNVISLDKVLAYLKSNCGNTVKFVYDNLKKFNEDTGFSINKLREQLDSMTRQLDTQSKSTLSAETIKRLLLAVTRQLPKDYEQTRPQPVKNTPQSSPQKQGEPARELECTPLEKAVFMLAQSQCLNFTRRYMKQIVDQAQPHGAILVCGWDSDKLTQFRNFFFTDSNNVESLDFNASKPPSLDMSDKLVFLIVNAEQKGSTEKKLYSEIPQRFLGNVVRDGKLVWVMDSVQGLANWRKPKEDTLSEAFYEMVKMAEAFTARCHNSPYDFMACDSELYYSVLFHELYFSKIDTEYKKQQLIQEFGELFHLNNERKAMTGRYFNEFHNLRRI